MASTTIHPSVRLLVDFLDTWQGCQCHLTSLEHSKSPSEGCSRIGDAHPVVLVIPGLPGYAPWKQISSLLTLASTQHGNTLRIENTGSTSCQPLRSSPGLARDDGDGLLVCQWRIKHRGPWTRCKRHTSNTSYRIIIRIGRVTWAASAPLDEGKIYSKEIFGCGVDPCLWIRHCELLIMEWCSSTVSCDGKSMLNWLNW